MDEPEILSEFNDQKLTATSPGIIDKLPKIQNPSSRQQVRSKAEQRKTPPSLPAIKNQSISPAEPPASNTKPVPLPERDDFAMQIQQKLKLVLENVNHGQIQEDSDGSEDVEFEELIQHNKQIIKGNKQKNELKSTPQNLPSKKSSKRKSKTIKTHAKNDNSVYQRKMKQFREGQAENKFLQKRKQILVQRQQAAERNTEKKIKQPREDSPMKDFRDKSKGTPPREGMMAPLSNFHSNKSVPRHNPPRSAFRQKKSTKNLSIKQDFRPPKAVSQQNKSANLFDNIHNLLLNPQKSRATSEVKRSDSSSIKLLEDKIKSINQKMGMKEESQPNLRTHDQGQKTALDWKRLEYDSSSLKFKCCFDSNFEKELDRIGYLQEKGNDYLSRLVNNQKTLVELALIKKAKPDIGQNTS